MNCVLPGGAGSMGPLLAELGCTPATSFEEGLCRTLRRVASFPAAGTQLS